MSSPSLSPPRPAGKPIPPLESGDHLTREEFERRYHAQPSLKKAELIEGVVYVSSPVRQSQHGGPHFDLIGWLSLYRMATPGVEGGDNSTLRLDLANVPQPDALLFLAPALGGQARIDEDGYIEEAPELVAEIAAASASIDLNTKLQVYQSFGVREYVVWRVLDQAIDWFVLRDSQFTRMTPSPEGWLKSEVFPGLWLDPNALLQSDMPALLAVAQQGISSAEHAAFVAELQRRRGTA
jgi:Uma2 family endonuclease